MCGILGIVGEKAFSVKSSLLSALRRLEYRGYDSCGYATGKGTLCKATGYIQNLECKDEKTSIAISHTRWATHGGITRENAHPHRSGDLYLVHNGIIENFADLKKKLEDKGYAFVSDTDSEAIAHFLSDRLRDGLSPGEAMKEFINTARGTFAVLWFRKGEETLYAMKRDSPLVLGLCPGRYVLASDIYAFSDETDRAIFFDDEEYAVITSSGYEFCDCFGDRLEKDISRFEWKEKAQTKKQYAHYMLKEIYEQPEAVSRLVNELRTTEKKRLGDFAELVKSSRSVVFLACGSSYHASLVGSFLFTQLGIRASSVIASESEHFLLVDRDTLVIPVSQSGETMDVVSVLKDIRLKKAKIASIVNVPYSTVQRLSDVSIQIMAGQEICVAATKSFTNQLVTLFALARELGNTSIDIGAIPDKIQQTIERNLEIIKALADELYPKNDVFVLGRGISYPIAREIALKLKEIPYQHAEGMMAGELKHGTIALVEQGTPVISLIPNANPDMVSSTREVEARGARTIIISNTNGDLHIPECSDAEFAVYACLVGYLLSYYIALQRGCPIDKPRNLAKSVTVK